MDRGEVVDADRLADYMLELQESKRTHNINFVSPTHNVLVIMKGIYVAIQRGLRLPIVWNSGGYDTVAQLRLLDGIVDIYMPDAKYASRAVARKLSRVDNYPEINQAAIKEMHRQVGLLRVDPRTGLAYQGVLVRHLILPWDYAGTQDVTNFLANEVSVHTYTHVMEYYRPEHEAARDTKFGMSGYPSRGELDRAHELARKEGLYRIHGSNNAGEIRLDESPSSSSCSLQDAAECECNPNELDEDVVRFVERRDEP
jgi:putative pyruvate formate lyase activating enzyme